MPGIPLLLGHNPNKQMNKKLPLNCEIETLDCNRKDRAFRLVFQAEDGGDDYHSEVYYPAKRQRLHTAAYEICARYGWLEFPPATGILTREELLKLEDLVDNAIDDMESNPARYVPDPEAFWRELFDWADDDQEFFMDGNDLLACGDPSIPELDEDHWTHRNYTHDIGRIIPKAVRDMKVSAGPRGIEIVKFSSGDNDGNWDVEAEFIRRQPGARITEEDRARGRETKAALEAAYQAYQAVDSKDATYGELSKAWRLAANADEVNRNMLGYNREEEDYWEPEEFRDYAVQMNCYWTLLRYKRYEIWCAIHGEDPLGNVNAEYEQVRATFDVTARTKGGNTVLTASLVKGNADLEKEALAYMDRYTVAELKKTLKENPKGRPLKEDKDRYGMRKGWVPREVTVASVTFRVSMAGRRMMPVTPLRIRQVSCRGLEEDVKRMMFQIEKNFPLDGGPPPAPTGHEL